MILILSNAGDATTDFFEARLRDAEVEHIRINTEHLAKIPMTLRTSAESNNGLTGTFELDGDLFEFDAIESVYYRRPVPPQLPAELSHGVRDWMESEIRRAWGGALASLAHTLWVNHPLKISGANYKPEQLARAIRAGIPVPPTVITSDVSVARSFCESLSWQVVTKPVGHGEVFGATESDDAAVYTNLVCMRDVEELSLVSNCPTLFQRALQKRLDIRATIVGLEVVSVALHSQDQEFSSVDCRRENMRGMRYSNHLLPQSLAESLVALTHSYGLSYSAIDLVLDQEGRYWFLELNSAGQWAWLEQVAAAPISAALIRCLQRRQS